PRSGTGGSGRLRPTRAGRAPGRSARRQAAPARCDRSVCRRRAWRSSLGSDDGGGDGDPGGEGGATAGGVRPVERFVGEVVVIDRPVVVVHGESPRAWVRAGRPGRPHG